MKTTVIACKTIEDELLLAMEQTGCRYDIHWVESGLHNVTEKLHNRLQQALDSMTGCDRVLMAFACCGGAAEGLVTGAYETVLPATDDCISMLIGSTAKRLAMPASKETYYLTRGWLDGERSIFTEYEYALSKYGRSVAGSIMQAMIGNYRQVALLDTGAYETAPQLARAEEIAKAFGLECRVISGTVEYLRGLLSGRHGEGFHIFPPHSVMDIHGGGVDLQF